MSNINITKFDFSDNIKRNIVKIIRFNAFVKNEMLIHCY